MRLPLRKLLKGVPFVLTTGQAIQHNDRFFFSHTLAYLLRLLYYSRHNRQPPLCRPLLQRKIQKAILLLRLSLR